MDWCRVHSLQRWASFGKARLPVGAKECYDALDFRGITMAKAAIKTTVKRSESNAVGIKRTTSAKAPGRLAKGSSALAEVVEEVEPLPRVVFNLEEAIRGLGADVAWLPPEVPVELIVREAEQVARAARPHRNRMRKLPTKIDLLDTLEARAHALAASDEEFRAARLARLKPELRPLREEAEQLKRELLTAAQFLLRDEPQILAQLSAVSDGDALDDLVEDLNVLVTIAKSRPSKFSIVDLTGGTQKAIARAKEIATRLATECEGERHDDAVMSAMRKRNRCYALVVQALEEVRAVSRFYFRNQPEMLLPFGSVYRVSGRGRSRYAVPTQAG